ncbi:MAG: phospholipid/cholesterol/gamma-HCH transport system substrate-binding protein [Mycobacterium sp.]|jgi:virulence factor Mce-like protein|nr:phospholipid/cholesterol/gamma-HCH transport system substrate-binding protein [Mycobacterium sp.]MDT5200562.1 phospholipid/cholesterol/gamma-HCH transport system substrate-binding protein [Mycobacterium sp.]MDT5254407.1 phospholipid/cholesterol/gamma-HCH transport system substrate-binding protein [Mycobacterium sp.]MDT5344999.1 phospholipid/cholesterol/gamma-HCH transport system substrate-binding protein [Mycobacterium sp.]
MLTRFVRIQLAIFAIVGIIGIIGMVLFYIQLPTLLGIGRMTVTLELPATGGLYRFSNVTYRGVQVGKVTAVALTANGAKATLSLGTSPKIPANLQADVLSVSAVGEQYVDLRPRTDSAPYLRDGSVIAMHDTTIPQAVGPMLDQLNALIKSLPKNKIGQLLDESFQAFNGAGYDLGSLSDSTSRISTDANSVVERTRALTEDSGPLLDSQAKTADSVRTWARSLAGLSDVVATDDSRVRTLLQNGSGAADEASRLFEQIKPTLPVLLANLTTLGQIGVTYHPSLEQLLVLLPPAVAITQTAAPFNHTDGWAKGDFSFTVDDPPICTVGFLPPNMWRSPSDTSDIDTPDGLYCKLPQDSPLSVRGARNYPCMGHPGKRAPTVEICNSDKPFIPIAMRQHILGPYPLDPNLLSQGIPPDDRTTADKRIFGPVEGTPLPMGAVPRGTPPGPRGATPPPGTLGAAAPPAPSSASMSTQAKDFPPIAPLDVPAQGELPPPPPAGPAPPIGPPSPDTVNGGPPQAHPSSFGTKASRHAPSVAVAPYDPRTGRYVAPDGKMYEQSDLATATTPKNWQDLFPT